MNEEIRSIIQAQLDVYKLSLDANNAGIKRLLKEYMNYKKNIEFLENKIKEFEDFLSTNRYTLEELVKYKGE